MGDRVAIDRTRLANDMLRFRARTFRLGWTRLVIAWCVAGYAPEVLVSGGVMFDELSHVRFHAALSHDGRDGPTGDLRSRSYGPLVE